MIKVLIADDEIRIRRGIKKLLNWEEHGLTIVGEAEDGEKALEIAKETKPDLCLLDICMPFLSGLDLITKLNEELDNTTIIIISGHDEFKYAQKALQLKVFDYVLKPIEKESLKQIIFDARNKIMDERSREEKERIAQDQLIKNKGYLKYNFLNELIEGKVKEEEVKEQCEIFNVVLPEDIGMLVIRILKRSDELLNLDKWQKELLCYGIKNITEEVMGNFKNVEILIDSKQQIVVICDITPIYLWKKLKIELENTINNYLKCEVIIEDEYISNLAFPFNQLYTDINNNLNERLKKTPIVLQVQKYIDRNYYKEDLTIADVSEEIGISQTYLTRLLKKELGMTFVDYVTRVRVKNAMILMEDPSIKMYEIAELVGYSTQHYFSNVFKKYIGIAPIDYKKGCRNEKN